MFKNFSKFAKRAMNKISSQRYAAQARFNDYVLFSELAIAIVAVTYPSTTEIG